MVLYIKSPSYYHHVLDQNVLLDAKKSVYARNNQRLRELKMLLSMTSPLSNHEQPLEIEHRNQLIRS